MRQILVHAYFTDKNQAPVYLESAPRQKYGMSHLQIVFGDKKECLEGFAFFVKKNCN